jgi:PST family polysaccharide transporter
MQTARKLVQNTAASMAGQIVTRGLGFVYGAALARYVHAEGMGELATAQSLATIVALGIGLGHETLAIKQLAHDRDRSSVWLSSLLVLKTGLSCAAILVLFAWSMLVGYSPSTLQVVIVYGIVIAVGTLVSTVRAVIIAHEHLAIEAFTQFVRDVTNIGLSLLAIWLQASLLTIVWVSVLANVLQLAIEMLVLRRLRIATLVRPSLIETRRILHQGLPFGANAVISVLLAQIGPVLLSVLAGAVATGVFWSANNLILLLLMPTIMYFWAVLPVFSRQRGSDQAELATTYAASIKASFVLGLPLAVGAALLASPAIRFVYGPGFEAAVPVLQILAVTVALSADYIVGAVLTALDRQRFLAITYGLELVGLVGIAMLLTPQFGPAGLAVGYALPRVVGFGVRGWSSYRTLGLPLPLGMLVRIGLATTIMGIAVNFSLEAGLHFALVAAIVGPAVYIAALIGVGAVGLHEWRMLRQVAQFG